MSLVFDTDRRYDQVCWLAAHNAFSSRAYRWIYNQQTMTFDEMYDFGVRCFSIDIHWHKYCSACSGDAREVAMMHGTSTVLNTVVQRQGPPQRFSEFLEVLSGWLGDMQKSRDIVTVTLESYIGDMDTINDLLDAHGLRDKMYVHRRNRDPWPTLGELRQAGTRLIVFSNNRGDCGTMSGVHYAPRFISSNHWDYRENPDGGVILRDRGALVKFNHIQPNSVNIGKRYQKFNAYTHMRDRAKAYREALGDPSRIPNFVNVDFVHIGNVKSLVEKFNNEFLTSVNTSENTSESE
jgi:hypothetical protein